MTEGIAPMIEQKHYEPGLGAEQLVEDVNANLLTTAKIIYPEINTDKKDKKPVGITSSPAISELFRALGAKNKQQLSLLNGFAQRDISLTGELRTNNPLREKIDEFNLRFNGVINRFLERSGISREEFLKSPAEVLAKLLIRDKKQAALITSAVVAGTFALSLINPEIAKNPDKNALASVLLATLVIGRTQQTGKLSDEKLLENLPSPIPPKKSRTEKIKETKQKIQHPRVLMAGCALALVNCCVLTALGVGIAWPEARKLALANAPKPTPIATQVPDSLSLELSHQNRALGIYDKYVKTTSSDYDFNPLNVDLPIIEDLTAYVGSTWSFVPERQAWLEKVFNRKFTPDEIMQIKNNPDMFFGILGDLKAEALRANDSKKADEIQKTIDFYKKRQNASSSQEFLDSIQNKTPFLIPLNQNEEVIIASLRKLNESGLLQSETYPGRKGSFANTGLPKSEILRRQKSA